MITRERSDPSHRDQPSWVKLVPTFLQLQVLDTVSCKLCNQCGSSPCTLEEIVHFLGYLCCLSLKPFQFLSCSYRTPTVSSSFLPGNSLLIVHTFNQLPCPKGMFNSIWVTRCFSVKKEHVVLLGEFAIKELDTISTMESVFVYQTFTLSLLCQVLFQVLYKYQLIQSGGRQYYYPQCNR